MQITDFVTGITVRAIFYTTKTGISAPYSPDLCSDGKQIDKKILILHLNTGHPYQAINT